jgi:hypothetical protein
VQYDGQERLIDLDSAVVLDKAQLPEFVHEMTDSRSGRANHLRQALLIDARNDPPPVLNLQHFFLAIA